MAISQPAYPVETDNLVTHVGAYVDSREAALDARLDVLEVVQVAGTPSIRAIGATGTTVIAGNDSRLTVGAAGTATVRAIGTTGTTCVAGDDTRLFAGAAGTATVRAIGASSTTVVAGDDTRLTAGAAGVATVRAIGTTATTACAGDDARLSNTRTPTSHASSHQPGGGDAMAVDAASATGSLRTLGTTSTAACAGNDARLSDVRTPVDASVTEAKLATALKALLSTSIVFAGSWPSRPSGWHHVEWHGGSVASNNPSASMATNDLWFPSSA